MAGPLKPLAAANATFKWALLFVATITILCVAGLAALAALAPDPMTKAQENLSSFCVHGAMTGLALFVGLAGGRAGQPDYFGHLPGGPTRL